MTLFERSSGCMMHRTAASQKCKFLALGKWKDELTQGMIPHAFFSLSDHLDFLGVQLKSTYSLTRKVNGDILQDRMKKIVGPWRGGRFMALNLRPHSLNTYAVSKLLYRCNTIKSRIGDIKMFNKTAKSFLYTDLLEKPDELVLYRYIEDGGLGFLNIQVRAKAALISTFLQTAINPNFTRNFYHNYLYRHYILGENFPKQEIPPNFSGDFFQTIRRIKDSPIDIEKCTLKQVYNFLMKDGLNVNKDDSPDEPLTPIKCETNFPRTDWKRTWRLACSKGIGPELTSFLKKLLWGIIPLRARLNRILPMSYLSPDCQLCKTIGGGTPETLTHALLTCVANQDLPARLLRTLQRYQPGAQQDCILSLDLLLEPSLELPFVWLIGSLLYSV